MANMLPRSANLIALATLALTLPAAGRPLSTAETMAARSGEIIGGASVCGVAGERLVALGKEVIEQVRFAAQSPSEQTLLQNVHEAALYALASKVSRHPGMCSKVTKSFQALERACLSERLLECSLQVPALRLPPR